MYATAQTVGYRSLTLGMGEAREQPVQGVAPTRRRDRDAITTTMAQDPHTGSCAAEEYLMNNIVWIVGAVVIVLVVLSVLGLR
ncbi:hypothetical protein BOX17_10935 [Halomonas aestuarii]|uniref:Uncharacterized protein n=1 Tax=Halomonas aestuarii TaxID=1897729 RepID=A0A1J0VHB4_9GAMM|nr:hypothetical protein [Halomonas aestuarii]APE31416.1 hypothetical protein BOX17_10935 [Halomonas aestuarii]